MRKSLPGLLGLATLAALAWPAAAPRADDVADFYKDRTVSIYVGVSPGGIYSTFALLLAKHMGKHLPGHPNIVVQHMPGAGGTKAVNYVFHVAPHDGTVVLTPNAGVDKRVALRIGNPKYDPARFHWLGGWGEAVNTLTLRSDAPVKTLDQARETEAVIAAIGKSSNTFMIPALINSTLGTRFKIITGYQGGAPIRAAIEKGEVHGWTGQWLGWKLAKPDWIREGRIVHLVQLASKRSPELPDVPLLSEFARNDEQRAMFEFVQTAIADRAIVAPPGVPPDRLAALGKAYQATIRDPEFVGEAAKRQYDITPVSGEEIQSYVAKIMATPPEMIEKLRAAMGAE